MSIMKIGIIRKVDELGRIVIPKELRRSLGIKEGTPLSISAEGSTIRLDMPGQGCVFCGKEDFLTEHMGAMVCISCVGELRGEW